MVNQNAKRKNKFCISLVFEGKDLEKIEGILDRTDCAEEIKDHALFKTRMLYASNLLARQEKNNFRNIIIALVIFVILGVIITHYTYYAVEKVFILSYG